MSYGLSLITAPSEEPLTLQEAKNHLRVETDFTNDDDLILGLIQAAREWAEGETDRAFITQTWDVTFSSFPCESYINIPKPNLVSVTTLKYYDENGVEQTWDSANYIVNAGSLPGRVSLAPNIVWPTIQAGRDKAVTIRFVCGYGDASAVPEAIKSAIKLKIGELYENREGVVYGVPNKLGAIDSLLSLYSVPEA